MARRRLGVVLVVPDPAATEIDGLRRALGATGLGRIPAHLTLVPPVNVREDRFGDAVSLARRAAADVAPLRLVLGPAATFWPATPVLYVEVRGDLDGVERLRDRVFVPPLERPLTWPFVPHVTLAEDVDPGQLDGAVTLLRSFRIETTVERMQVLEEQEGRSWTVLADVALGGGRVVGRGGLEVELTVGAGPDVEAEAFLRQRWAGRLRPFVVTARREGAIVGVAIGGTDDELWLDHLVVDPSTRGQGIGRQLLAEVEHLGAVRGCRLGLLLCKADEPAGGLPADEPAGGLPAEEPPADGRADGSPAGWFGSHGWRQEERLRAWRHGRDFVRLSRDLSR